MLPQKTLCKLHFLDTALEHVQIMAIRGNHPSPMFTLPHIFITTNQSAESRISTLKNEHTHTHTPIVRLGASQPGYKLTWSLVYLCLCVSVKLSADFGEIPPYCYCTCMSRRLPVPDLLKLKSWWNTLMSLHNINVVYWSSTEVQLEATNCGQK